MTLYKEINSVLHYHEAWVDNNIIVEHWGEIGEEGKIKKHKFKKKIPNEEDIKVILQSGIDKGFREIPIEKHKTLILEFNLKKFGIGSYVDKMEKLIYLIDEALSWTGIGNYNRNSIGSGTLELFCDVVDFKKAKEVIEYNLKKTKFSNYSKIHDEDD